jgi:hypothetical protein
MSDSSPKSTGPQFRTATTTAQQSGGGEVEYRRIPVAIAVLVRRNGGYLL